MVGITAADMDTEHAHPVPPSGEVSEEAEESGFAIGVSEWLVRRTTARTRRALNFWLFLIWLVPGTAVWIWLRDALWFVGFMSLYAIWITHWSGFSAETPVEEEDPARVSRGSPGAR